MSQDGEEEFDDPSPLRLWLRWLAFWLTRARAFTALPASAGAFIGWRLEFHGADAWKLAVASVVISYFVAPLGVAVQALLSRSINRAHQASDDEKVALLLLGAREDDVSPFPRFWAMFPWQVLAVVLATWAYTTDVL